MADDRKFPRGQVARVKRALEKKKDGLISCLELADKFHREIARIETELRSMQSK